MTQKKDNIINIKIIVIYGLVFASFVWLVHYYVSDAGLAALDSDMTQGIQMMVEGLKEHTIFPQNWNYANTLNIPWSLLDHMFFYKITGSYLKTLILDKIFWVILMLFSIFFFGKRVLKFDTLWIGICMIFILIPFSAEYYKSVFFWGYYYRIFAWFMMLALGSESVEESGIQIKWRPLLWLCIFLIAFMTGDARFLAVFVLPFLLAVFMCYIIEHREESIKTVKKPLIQLGILVLGMGVSYIICHGIEQYLSLSHSLRKGYYDYTTLSEDALQEQFIDRAMLIIKEVMIGFGYIGDAPQMSLNSVLTFLALIGMLVILGIIPILMIKNYMSYPMMIKRLIIFRWIGYAVSIYFALFVLVGVGFRHFLTFFILDILLTIYYIKETYMKEKNIQYYASALVILGYALLGWISPMQIADVSVLSDRNAVIQALEDRNLTYGYAEYWSASVIQTFSHDSLLIYPCTRENIRRWYSPKELYLSPESEEPTFYISETDTYREDEQNPNFQKLYGDYVEKLEFGNYVVLIFDYNIVHNFREYRAEGGYDLIKYLYSSNPKEQDTRNTIYLESDEYVYGPYISLESGEYDLSIEAEGRCECRVYAGETLLLDTTKLKSGNNVITFSVEQDVSNVEIWIHSLGKEVILKKLTVNDTLS